MAFFKASYPVMGLQKAPCDLLPALLTGLLSHRLGLLATFLPQTSAPWCAKLRPALAALAAWSLHSQLLVLQQLNSGSLEQLSLTCPI